MLEPLERVIDEPVHGHVTKVCMIVIPAFQGLSAASRASSPDGANHCQCCTDRR